jgi:hypothetical protein
MNREAIEVGAFTWSRVQRLYDVDAAVHWQRCEAEGLECPQEVFAQLFHEDANNPDFAAIVRAVDYSAPSASPLAHRSGPPWPGVRHRVALSWGRVGRELQEVSWVARYMDVATGSTSPEGEPESRLWVADVGRGQEVRTARPEGEQYQYALDEARQRAAQFGIVDERKEVVEHWEEAQSWVVAPVVVAADLLGGGGGYELLVGYTRLGNLLGMLDRQDVSDTHRHLVWVGRRMESA